MRLAWRAAGWIERDARLGASDIRGEYHLGILSIRSWPRRGASRVGAARESIRNRERCGVSDHESGLPPLGDDELRRYGRHLVLPEVGLEGQQRLKAARVLVVGAGGLGSPLALYLAAAGVGRIGLVDFDRVDLSNLQRQVLYDTRDVGRAKLAAASERLRALNPEIEVRAHEVRLASDNAFEILGDYDVVADGTDNFPTRYLVNDACVLLGKPNVHGSIFRFEGQVSVFDAARGPCYRCLFADPPPAGLVPSCAEGGVLGVLPGVIGVLQAIETVKLILGIGEPLIGRLLIFDALAMRFRELKLRKDPNCRLCGANPTVRALIDYESFCGVGADAAGAGAEQLTVRELAGLRARGEAPELLDVREPFEIRVAHLEGARLIPLGGLAERVAELDRSRPWVVMCHHGTRSARAAEFLRAQGFTNVRNLTGGIDAWSLEVDPTVPRY
ncbi:MAG: molybdopterin-synthase adenylyltransferase MoeB [Candidatus Eisenbacteria bacterium]|uniref:Molybdopterin-synthase adenylyltransferase MoeB n=1 Tax=Eiseniibacteriota bacterium TaxID=2212470 RepID=A0A849SKP6_UNCEI|nr:molybdopterin-synthase adenylyltransferase MoeB [Candidatus Eisenbacteria bacterium]